MKRAALALAAVALVMGIAPAHAQTGPRAAVTAPSDGAIVSGSTSLRGSGSATTGVRAVYLYVDDTLVATREPSDLRQNVDIDYTWHTYYLPGSSQITPNGWYEISVRVVGVEGGEATATRNIRVDNGAAIPTGLAVNTNGKTVELTWNPNAEPDIVGYRVEADSGGGFTTLTTTSAARYSYTASPGAYSWRVIAIRRSETDPSGHASGPSEAVSASIAAHAETRGGGGASRGGKGGGTAGEKKIFGDSNKKARAFVRATRQRFASLGISRAGISLPGAALGLPRLPDGEVEWGTYKAKLPYGMPQQDSPLAGEPVRLAARSTSTVMPLDALQWLATGILMVIVAALLQFLAFQTARHHTPKEQTQAP